MTAIEPGSVWVAKDGRRTLRVEYVGYGHCDVRNIATGRAHVISCDGLLRKYHPKAADQ